MASITLKLVLWLWSLERKLLDGIMMINGYQSKLLDIYSKIREEENNLLKKENTIKNIILKF